MLTFDAKLGLVPSDTATIRAEVVAEFLRIFGADLVTEASTPAGQLIDSITAMIATKESELVRLSNQFNPLVADGVWQDALGYIYFLSRKVATSTLVTCQCMGLQGVTIPQNSVVKTSDNLFLHSLEEATFDASGVMDVLFAVQDTGPVPVVAGSVTTIVSVIPGWDTVINENDGVLGADEETRNAFERRRYASVAKNAYGTVAALYGTLADIENVVDVVVLENRGDAPITEAGVTIDGHSVYISIFGGSDVAIAQGIYLKLGAGCGTTGNDVVVFADTEFHGAVYTYNITRPTPTPIYIKVTLRETENTPASIVEDVRSAIVANFDGLDSETGVRVPMANVLYASRFYTSIINAGGTELISCEVGFAADVTGDDIFINADVFPTVDADNISVNLVTR